MKPVMRLDDSNVFRPFPLTLLLRWFPRQSSLVFHLFPYNFLLPIIHLYLQTCTAPTDAAVPIFVFSTSSVAMDGMTALSGMMKTTAVSHPSPQLETSAGSVLEKKNGALEDCNVYKNLYEMKIAFVLSKGFARLEQFFCRTAPERAC